MNEVAYRDSLEKSEFLGTEIIAQSWARVRSVDFTPIVMKLTDIEHGKGWTLADAERAERLYRCFLTLQLAYKGRGWPIVPFEEADEFWHQHILDTRKYMSDCDKLFGEYLHHFPYFGMRGEQDAKNFVKAGELTFDLFRQHFPEDTNELIGKCSACQRCASCRSK